MSRGWGRLSCHARTLGPVCAQVSLKCHTLRRPRILPKLFSPTSGSQHFEKKSHVIVCSRFPTVITFSWCIEGGGVIQPPPKTDHLGRSRKGGHILPLLSPLFINRFPWYFHIKNDISFPKRLTLYDLYNVINDVIHSKNRKFEEKKSYKSQFTDAN